ncbi:MAG: hypothetical protein ACJAZ3_001064 [Sphingobacteriales bacterium]|jgi:uncharacterized protein (DUF1015 family)
MPKVKAFKGIRPISDKVSEIIVKPADLADGVDVEEIKRNNPYSFLHVISPRKNGKFDLESAAKHFEKFVELGLLRTDKDESIYIFRVNHHGKKHVGVWLTTSIDEYLDGNIKKHEHTREYREKQLVDFYEQTGVDANPVMLTYNPSFKINQLINEVVQNDQGMKTLDCMEEVEYKLCQVGNPELVLRFKNAFAEIKEAYIADGHHRVAAAAIMGQKQRKNNPEYTGEEDFNFFSSIYFSSDQLIIHEYNRIIRDLGGLSYEQFLAKVEVNFTVEKLSEYRLPEHHEIAMYLGTTWFSLKVNQSSIKGKDVVHLLDVSILQDNILEPILDIKDPRTDLRISFVDGIAGVKQLTDKVDNGEAAIAFSLHPCSVEEIMQVADVNQIMPPKSTWVEPKLHCGLITHKLK